MAPVCFLSYSRRHLDFGADTLRRFVEDFRNRLAEEWGLARNEVLYYDENSKSAGSLWEVSIGEALAGGAVLVPLYSPFYFNVGEDECYCGKEFQLFWERPRNALPGSASITVPILPVLWTRRDSLRLHKPDGLPPQWLRGLDYQLTDPDATAEERGHYDRYNKQGLSDILNGSTSDKLDVYPTILRRLRNRVRELSELYPPPSTGIVRFADIRCAFHDDVAGEPAAPPIGDLVVESDAGPGRILVVTCSVSDASPILTKVAAAVRDVAFAEGLDCQPGAFRSTSDFDVLIEKLADASNRNQIALLVVDAQLLSQHQPATSMAEVLRSNEWVGGALVVGDPPLPPDNGKDVLVLRLALDGTSYGEGLGSWLESWEAEIGNFLIDLRGQAVRRASTVRPYAGAGPRRLPLT